MTRLLAVPSLLYHPHFFSSFPFKQNIVNYLFTSPLNKNVLIVHTSLMHLVALLREHSMGLWPSHFPLHLVSFFLLSSPSLCISTPTSAACIPRLLFSSLSFSSFSVVIFLPYTSRSLPPSPSFFSGVFCPTLSPSATFIWLAASGLFHSIKARVLLLLLPLIMKALRLACCQAVTGTIINRHHSSSPSPAITGLITII